MDFKYTFLVAVMCLLVPADARRRTAKDISLGSLFRQESCLNQTGYLLQIHFDGSNTQARCDGTSTKSLTTKFTIEDTRNKKCIQYKDKQGGNTRYYTLKVIDGTKVTFMNERCSSSTADAFLFDEERESPNSRYRYYKHTLPNNTNLYLGVNSCNDDRLSLICNKIDDRRCKFRRRS